MRGDNEKQTDSKQISSVKTLATSLAISSAITVAAMAFRLVQMKETIVSSFPLSFVSMLWLHLSIYGFVTLVSFVLMALGWIYPEKQWMVKVIDISCFVQGALLALMSLPFVIYLKSVEFFISVLVIGICVFMMGIFHEKSIKG